MKQEDKELLLKDLCVRLPYGVICYWKIGSELTLNLTEYNGRLTCINKVEIEDSSDYYYDCYFNVCNDSNGNSFQNEDVPIEIVKPYLRPMSSMTEEEKKELIHLVVYVEGPSVIKQIKDGGLDIIEGKYQFHSLRVLNWLNAKGFDYRGLLEKGLALPALENMYKKTSNKESNEDIS